MQKRHGKSATEGKHTMMLARNEKHNKRRDYQDDHENEPEQVDHHGWQAMLGRRMNVEGLESRARRIRMEMKREAMGVMVVFVVMLSGERIPDFNILRSGGIASRSEIVCLDDGGTL